MADKTMLQPGFLIDVPITLSLVVRGADRVEKAEQVARMFADGLDPDAVYAGALFQEIVRLFPGVTVSEVSMESSREESCEVLEELEAEE